MVASCLRLALACLLLLAAQGAIAQPRLERDSCSFRPPRGDRLECYILAVPENRANPTSPEVRLKVAVLKAKRPLAADPVIYLAGGPGDSPLVASTSGADALSEGDWWNDTAVIRKRRDVIIISERGAGGSSPNLDCFEPRTSEPSRAKRRAITEVQEQEILQRCRADFDARKIDLAMYATPTLADDVADLVQAMRLDKVNLYGISYGTRWALEVMRRHPSIVRSAVLDGIYPPQINGEQNETEIVRTMFEQLYGDCAADKRCRERNPGLAANVEFLVGQAEKKPFKLTVELEDGPQVVDLDGSRLLLVLLHMMRQGKAALVPEAVTALKRGDKRLIKQFAEDLEDDDGGLLETNAQQFGGLFNTIECRETWTGIDQNARDRAIRTGGVYGLTAILSKLSAFCPAWRVPSAPSVERQPVTAPIRTLLISGGYDWLTPADWGREAARNLPESRHVVFRALGHGVTAQDGCAARVRDAFIEAPDPRLPLPCRVDAAPDFGRAADRARALTALNRGK